MSRYTVMRTRGCVVIEGAVPVMDFVALCRSWEAEADQGEWIVDGLLAERLGASFVLGPKENCLLWREQLAIAPEGPPGREREAVEGQVPADAKNAPNARYEIVTDPHPSITCHKCGKTSYNVNDIQYRYCGNCNEWMGD